MERSEVVPGDWRLEAIQSKGRKSQNVSKNNGHIFEKGRVSDQTFGYGMHETNYTWEISWTRCKRKEISPVQSSKFSHFVQDTFAQKPARR